MLVGTCASTRLVADYQGQTVHRRTVKVKSNMADLHVRVRDALAGTNAFNGGGYLTMLGQELGNMPAEAYVLLVQYLLDYLAMVTPGGGVGENAVLCQFPEDYGLYARLAETPIFRSLRYMMCKSLI